MKHVRRMLLLLTMLLGVVSLEAAPPKTINQKVVKFCKDHLGKNIGAGECCNLAEEALEYAGAKPRTTFPDTPSEGDYVWGRLVYSLEMKNKSLKETKNRKDRIEPGDVIQFRDAAFKGENLRGFQSYEASYSHHTAVIVAVRRVDGLLMILEQNIDGKKYVVASTYRLSDLKAGWVHVFRPIPK